MREKGDPAPKPVSQKANEIIASSQKETESGPPRITREIREDRMNKPL